MGPQIVSKAVLLVWTNLGAAVRATALPFALIAALPFLLLTGSGDGVGRSFASMGMILVLSAILFAWAATSWHRYVLLHEEPSIVPMPGAPAIIGYLWAGIRVGMVAVVLMLVVALVFSIIGSTLVAVFGEGLWLLALAGFGISVLVSYVLLRLSLILPAAALGRAMSLGESWSATSRARDAVLVTALLVSLLQFLLQMVGTALPRAGVPGLLLSLTVTWASAMIGLSVLTALYGVLVEGRSVD